MRWEAAPKPRLTDRSYKKGYWERYEKMTDAEKDAKAAERDWAITEEEPLFDAADVARFGRDFFVQPSTATNMAGIDWIRRHFPDHRIHLLDFEEESPMHIDATFVPLRPGLIISNRGRKPRHPEQLEIFKKNDWEIVECAEPALDKKPPLCYCSVWLSINFLVLDPKTVCVEAGETAQMEQLDKLGFEVVPVPFWDVGAFGGGLHCATADVYREGSCEDYFSHQV
jgi:glycine amidinotransferase